MQDGLKLSELTKPIDTLIREISQGVSALSEGPLRRWNEKRDLIHAMNMCNIIDRARVKKDQANSTSLGVDSGWLLNFLDKCKTVSDANMQDLWASILAKESDTPGGVSQLAINSLENFAKQDAESFTALCGFVCEVNSEQIPLIENPNHEIYTKNGINSDVLEHLCTLNVIEHSGFFGGNRGTTKPPIPNLNSGESISLFYFGKRLDYVNAGQDRDSLNVGAITFTSIGKEFLSICDNKEVDGFFEYLKHNWRWSKMIGARWSVDRNKIVRIKGELTTIQDYTEVIDLDPEHANAYYNRGVVYGKKGEFDAAIQGFSKAIDLNPDLAEAYTNRGAAYHHKGEFDKTIKDYNKAIDLNPDYADAYYNRGNAYYRKSEFDRAIQDYTKAIDLNPKDAEAYANRGEVWLHLSEWEKAKADLSTAKDMGNDIVAAFHNAYGSIEDFEKKRGVEVPEDIAALLSRD